MLRLLIASTAIALTGCASSFIDVSDSKGALVPSGHARYDYKFEVLNEAPNLESEITAFSTQRIAIPSKITTGDIVAADVREILSKRVNIASENRMIVARVRKADAYWIYPGVKKVPIIGLFALGLDDTYVVDIELLFEVDEIGKTRKFFKYARKFEINDGSGNTPDQIKASFERIFSLYRKELAAQLDSEFMPKYLGPQTP